MGKKIFTYLLMFILLGGIVVPSYISITEDLCEAAFQLDIEEDTDTNEESEKTELKLLGVPFQTEKLGLIAFQQKKCGYTTKVYTTVYKNLELPPPEQL